MQITVPARLCSGPSAPLFELQAVTKSFTGQNIILDCSKLNYVDPLGLCVLHHWFQDLEGQGITVELRDMSYDAESWLRRMDVFSGLRNLVFEDRTSQNQRNDHAGNLIEVRCVDSLDQIDIVAAEIASAIVKDVPDMSWETVDGMQPSEADKVSTELEYLFSELLNNALAHGRLRGYPDAHAKVSAQYYPKVGRLRIAIVDNGCGLLQTLQAHEKMDGEQTCFKAIQIALEPTVSCNREQGLRTDAKNQGFGLTIVTRMALDTGGLVAIFSGDGRLKQSGDGEPEMSPMHNWQGTAVYLEFDRKALSKINRAKIAQSMPGFEIVDSLVFD